MDTNTHEFAGIQRLFRHMIRWTETPAADRKTMDRTRGMAFQDPFLVSS
jgi:hypothetical protein